jgi:hypothetical protein
MSFGVTNSIRGNDAQVKQVFFIVVPGRVEGNRRWQCTEDMVSEPAFEWVRGLTKSSNRLGLAETPSTVKALEVSR